MGTLLVGGRAASAHALLDLSSHVPPLLYIIFHFLFNRLQRHGGTATAFGRQSDWVLRVGLDVYVHPQDGQPRDPAHGLEEHPGKEGGRKRGRGVFLVELSCDGNREKG